MNALAVGALASLAYLLMLAHSAWKQGEIRKFVISLLILIGLCTALSGIVAIAIYTDGH